MKNYIYPNLWTQELEDAIERSPTRYLVEEMFYKYGLKVMAIETQFRQWNYDKNCYEDILMPDNFIVTTDGYPVASLFTTLENGKVTYGIFSPRIRKERGSDDRDRQSYTSSKLSQLMKTIEKRNLMNKIEVPIDAKLIQIIEKTDRHIKPERDNKHIGYSNSEAIEAVHQILKTVNDKKPLDSLPQNIVKHCKELVDIFDKVDKNNKQHEEKLIELFKTFYVLYTDASDGIVVSKYNAEIVQNAKVNIEEIVSPVRVRNIEEHEDFEDFGGLLTMFKVALKDMKLTETIAKDIFPRIDNYFEDFGISSYYFSGYAQFGGLYLCIPASK